MCPCCGSRNIDILPDSHGFNSATEMGLRCADCGEEWAIPRFMDYEDEEDEDEFLPSVKSIFKQSIVKLLQVENHEEGPVLTVLVRLHDPDKAFLGFEPYTSIVLNLSYNTENNSIVYQDVTPDDMFEFSPTLWKKFCDDRSKKEIHEMALLIYTYAYEYAKKMNNISKSGTVIHISTISKLQKGIRRVCG